MRHGLVLLLLAACASPRAPSLANRPAPAKAEPILPAPEPTNCTVDGSTTMRVAGALAKVEVVTCDLGAKPYDDQDPDSPTVSSFEGYLKVTRAGKPVVRSQIEEWDNGWEWGASLALEGALVATGGDTDAVLILHPKQFSDESSVGLIAYTVKDDELVRVGAWNNDLMIITWNKASTIARVQTCVFGDPSLAHAGCGDRPDADPGPTFELQWTGTRIDEAAKAP